MAKINFKQVKHFQNASNIEFGFAPTVNISDYFSRTGAYPSPKDCEEIQTLEHRQMDLHPSTALITEVMFCDFFKQYFEITNFRPESKEDKQVFLIYMIGLFCENGILETLPTTKEWTKDNIFRTGYGGGMEIEHFTPKPRRYFFRKFIFEQNSLDELTIFITENRSALVIDMEFLRQCYIKSFQL